MRAKSQSLAKFELPAFFALAYLLSWWSAPFAGGSIIPHGPALAAVVAVLIFQGRQGLRQFWSNLWNWRAGWWYLLGPAIILGYQSVAYWVNLLAGGELASAPQLPAASVWLELLLLGGLWEEIGWSGYALPKIYAVYQRRRGGLLIAALILGVFRALWHLPLFLSGNIYWFDLLIFAFGFQLLIAWIYYRSGRSLPAVMVFHFASNLLGSVFSPAFSGGERILYYAIFMGLATVLGFAVMIFSPPKQALEEKSAVTHQMPV